MAKEMPWREAIERVLQGAPPSGLHYTEITKRIVEQKLRTNVGATPDASVAATITLAFQKDGDACPFFRVERGVYAWKQKLAGTSAASVDKELVTTEEDIEESGRGVIQSFGMFWRKEAVDWNSKAKILGMQQIGANAVDFHEQLGIYLLYDGRDVVYVGRSTDRPLGLRLYEHTRDRLSTRWDRFSWFGLRSVSEDGQLSDMPETYPSESIIPALEAMLIEALEPPQNRKRGDDLGAVEFIQMEDPEIQRKKRKQILEDALLKA